MRKIYILPNMVTTANMFCGFYSVILSSRGEFLHASWAIIAAAVFDAMDGRIARMAKATSQFGVEYDSLSDLTSFGMAPAFLMYYWALLPFERLGWVAAFMYLACAALRLARFNTNTAVAPKGFFQGLASPIAAGLLATLVIFQNATGFPDADSETIFSTRVLGLTSVLLTAALMVSTIRFPSFKELNWRSKATFGYLMILMVTLVLVALKPEITLFVVTCSYICLSLIWNVYRLLAGKTEEVSA
ncbi:MAG: CDP-diacylglycerol--serine O-phosphatidyltransferase [Bdellovibrionales bacterium]|nr:CDP-diacylglycerol--serine O-phosphatidyltransferase [Bdellovibrionales bacterium]